MDELKNVVEEARQLDEELDALDVTPQPHERKIRFAPDNAKAAILNGLFAPKRDPRTYGLEEITLGRMLLASRGSVLPDDLESRFQNLAGSVMKRTMTTDGTGTGAELIDTLIWPTLFQDIVSKTLVAELFRPWLPMSTKSLELPSLGNVTFYTPAGEGQTVTPTDLDTSKKPTLTAYTTKAQVDVSDEESEDSIINLLPEIRSILVRNAKEVIDELILCADASTGKQNINYYATSGGSDIDTDSRFLIGFDGTLHYCLNEVTGNVVNVNAAIDAADIRNILAAMGKYGVDPSRVAFLCDIWNKNVLLGLDELHTVDKQGASATILTGEVGKIYGSPVIVSTALAKSNATGQVDQNSGNNTKGRFLAINRDMWRLGMRRNIRVATQRDEPKGLTSIVVTLRIALQCYGDRSSADYTHAVLGYNCTV